MTQLSALWPDSILIGAQHWVLPAVALFTLAAGVLAWGYRRMPGRGSWRVAAVLLKGTGVAALALCLIEPLWSGVRPRPGENLFLIVADNSQSLGIRDTDASQTRGEILQELLHPAEIAWQSRLQQDFDVRRSLTDRRFPSVPDFARLNFEGSTSPLEAALESLAERFHGRPIAGVLLFTDGIATDAAAAPRNGADRKGLPPIYPVAIGRDGAPRDVALRNVTVTETAFEDAPVTIQAEVLATGYDGAEIVAQLFDEAGTLVQTETRPVDKDVPLGFRFQLRPERPGLAFYRLRVAAAGEMSQFSTSQPAEPGKAVAASREATLANNERLVRVSREAGPYRILYVSGRPNWEFKFLRRALEADQQVQLVGLVRIANREPKFDWRGRVGESSNPLFRGFKKEGDEEAERYDQPVLVRLNTRDDAELRDGFPKSAEALFGYHAVILDDLEAGFFTHGQQALLAKFVSERGGGLLMLGGQESFQNGKYQRTPLGDLLPVYVDRIEEVRPTIGYRLALTRDGWLQPWVRLRDNETDEQQRLEEMPAFTTLNRVRNLKPGASILATVEDPAGSVSPALAVQQFGRGRSAALMIGDLWRWGLRQEPERRDLDKAWRQMIRWLISDVPAQVEIEVADELREAVRLQVRVLKADYVPLENGAVKLTVRSPGAAPLEMDAEPALDEAGLYTARFVPPRAGAFRVQAVVRDAGGKEVGRNESGWVADPVVKEFRTLRPDRDWLATLARQTGGEMVEPQDLSGFVESLPNRKIPITEQWTMPLWHQPFVFLFAIACLVGEWGLRRWHGFA
jgi:uncharacterized membrane protein